MTDLRITDAPTTSRGAATRCLHAAADLDPDETASQIELAVIAFAIARQLFPDDRFNILGEIADLTHMMPSDIIRGADDDR